MRDNWRLGRYHGAVEVAHGLQRGGMKPCACGCAGSERLATRTSFVDAHPSGELGGSLGGSAAAASIFGDLGGVEDERFISGDCAGGDVAAGDGLCCGRGGARGVEAILEISFL